MDALCRFLWTLLCQIAATIGCLVLLILMLSVPSALLGYSCCYPEWHELFANFMTAPLILYLSLKIGFHYGHPARPLPMYWFWHLAGLAGCLALFWGMVRMGLLDLISHLISPLSSDYLAGDLPPWNFGLTALLLVKVAIAITAIVYLGKKCLSGVRNSTLPVINEQSGEASL